MPSDAPYCRHDHTQRISSHENLSAAVAEGEPIASTYICDRPECVEKARFWVQGNTGKLAILVPFKKPASA